MIEAVATEPPETPVRDLGDGALLVKFACRSVWKVFGDGAARFLARNDLAPTAAELAEAGLIGAVRDVVVDIDAADRPFALRDDGGRLIGKLERDDLIAVLIGRDRRH